MISTYASGIQTGTIGSEIFLSSPNVQGKFTLQVDLSNMLAGDFTEIRKYKMVINSGTARAIDVQTYQGAQPTDLLIAVSDPVWNSLTDTNAVRFSLKQSLGTARAYAWSVLLEDSLAPTVSGRTIGVDSNGKVSLSDPQSFNLIGNISGTITNVYNVISGTASPGSDPWLTAVPGAYGVGTAGYILGNNLDARVSSRMASGTVFVQDKTGFSLVSPQNFDLIGNVSGTITNVYNVISGTTSTLDASQVWSYSGTRSLNGQQYWNLSGTVLNVNNVLSPIVVGTNNDKSGYSLSSPQSFNLIGNISGSLAGSVINVVSGSSSGPTLSQIVNGVWDEQISGHLITGSTGKTLNNAGSAGDPWGTSLPDGYGAGTAGYILGNNLDTLVSSRMASGTVVVSSNQDKTGYSLATGTNLPVNVKQINDTNLQGNGSTTPWGPA